MDTTVTKEGLLRELTALKEDNVLLRDDLIFFRDLVEEGNDALFFVDRQSAGFIDVNKKALSLLGYTRAELLGLKFVDITPNLPDGLSWDGYIEKMLTDGVLIAEGVYKRRDATTFPVLSNIRLATYKGKQCVIAIVSDISKRREVEDELRRLYEDMESRVEERTAQLDESHRVQATLLSNLPGMAYRSQNTRESTMEVVSAGSFELTGYTPLELINNKTVSFASLIDSLDREYVWSEVQGALAKKKPYTLLYRLNTLSSKQKWVWEQGRGVFSDEGNLLALEGFITDITERKLAEDQLMLFKEVITHSNDAIVITDAQGGYLEQNSASKQLLGYSDEELQSMRPGVFIGEDNYDDLKKKLFRDGNFFTQMMITVKDDTKLDVEVSAFTVKSETGNITNLVLILRDITERKQREEEHIKVGRLESISILAGGIAHDFNNQLTGIMANIEMSKRLVKPDSQVSKKLIDAEKACEKARELTRQLLTFSSGGEPVKKRLKLKQVIEESVNLVLSSSNVKCSYRIADDLMPVDVDPSQMSQALNNLLINADHAMPDGGTIILSAKNIDVGSDSVMPLKQGRYVRVSIEDNGSGISNEYLSKVFDPYFTTKDTGSGLGLAMVYSIIHKHDGHVFLQSELGVGTTIKIYIPVASGELNQGSEQSTGVVDGVTTSGKVLVMDDEQIVRDVACEVLKNAGFDVDPADNGRVAIKLYKEAMARGFPYDLIIMDLTVPGDMGGKEAIGELLKIDANVKAIVSSGYSNDPVMADHKSFGFVGMLAKPYAIMELQGMVSKIIWQGQTQAPDGLEDQ